ncbi:hypothetical protein ABBQ38_010272 [Trebouxia sp. C0009 RCD-2024]
MWTLRFPTSRNWQKRHSSSWLIRSTSMRNTCAAPRLLQKSMIRVPTCTALQASIAAAKAKELHITSKCSELGIKGRNIPRELAQLQQQLPGLFQDALADINSPAIASAMDHYAAVTAYAHSPAPDAAAPDPSQTPPTDLKQLLPHLQAIRSNNHLQQLGTNPSDTANRTEDEAVSVQGDSQEIQWDVTGDESPRSQESADAANAGGAAIDWDVTIDPGADTTEAEASSPPAEAVDISWDIDITEAAEQTQGLNSEGGSGQGSGQGFGPPELLNGNAEQEGIWPESVVRLTKDTSCRTALLDDLHELNAFLLQQMQEMASGGHESLASAAPESIQRVGLSGVQQQSKAVTNVLTKMTSKKVQQLVMIQTSSQYSSRLARALQQKGSQHEKFLRLARETQAKQEEQERSLRSNAPKLQGLIQETRRIKTYVEETISVLYSGRQVNIIGEINNVI